MCSATARRASHGRPRLAGRPEANQRGLHRPEPAPSQAGGEARIPPQGSRRHVDLPGHRGRGDPGPIPPGPSFILLGRGHPLAGPARQDGRTAGEEVPRRLPHAHRVHRPSPYGPGPPLSQVAKGVNLGATGYLNTKDTKYTKRSAARRSAREPIVDFFRLISCISWSKNPIGPPWLVVSFVVSSERTLDRLADMVPDGPFEQLPGQRDMSLGVKGVLVVPQPDLVAGAGDRRGTVVFRPVQARSRSRTLIWPRRSPLRASLAPCPGADRAPPRGLIVPCARLRSVRFMPRIKRPRDGNPRKAGAVVRQEAAAVAWAFLNRSAIFIMDRRSRRIGPREMSGSSPDPSRSREKP